MKVTKLINNFFRQIRYSSYIIFLNLKNKKNIYNLPYSKNDTLKLLFNKYGSDKGNLNNKHNYSKFYDSLFCEIKNDKLNIMEVGLGSIDQSVNFHMKFMGEKYKPLASLYAWRDYFRNSNIFGADIDKKILIDTDKIKTFYVDMFNSFLIKEMWKKVNKEIDILIDDGYHSFEANKNLFLNSFKFIKKGGYYIIEDVHRKPNNIKKFYDLLVKENLDFRIVDIYHSNNVNDNCLIVIKK